MSWKKTEDLVERIKRKMRRDNPQVDVGLVKFYGSVPATIEGQRVYAEGKPPVEQLFALLSGQQRIGAKDVAALERRRITTLEDIAGLSNLFLASVTGAKREQVAKWDWQGQAKRILGKGN